MPLKPLNRKLVFARIVLLLVSFNILLVSLFYLPLTYSSLVYILLFAFFIFLTDLIIIDIEQEGTLNASIAIILTAVFLGNTEIPLVIIMLAVIFANIGSLLILRKNFLKQLMSSSKKIIAILAASFVVFVWQYLFGYPQIFLTKLVMASISALVYFITNTILQNYFLSLKKGVSFKFSALRRARLLGATFFTFSAIALLMAIMFERMGFWSILIFSLPLFATSQSFKLYLDIRRTYNSTIKALSATIEAQDSSREGHAQRVTDYAMAIGRELGYYGKDLEKLNHASMLHDIGKLGFDKSVRIEEITKEYSPLNKREIPFHAQIGSEIISHVDYLKDVSSIIKLHHYPYGNKSINVPLESRIINIADAFDHLTNDASLEPTQALNKLKQNNDLEYNPKVMRAFATIFTRE